MAVVDKRDVKEGEIIQNICRTNELFLQPIGVAAAHRDEQARTRFHHLSLPGGVPSFLSISQHQLLN